MENNTTQILKNNLILLRRNAHLTQEQFADKLGLSFQAVSKWENGLSCPDIALLPEIAKIYGISMDKLFTPMEPEEFSRQEPDPESPEDSWEQTAREAEAREEAQEARWEQKAREEEAKQALREQKQREAEAREALREQKIREAEELSQTDGPAQDDAPKEPEQPFDPFSSGDFGASLGQYVNQIVKQAMERTSARLQKMPFNKDFHFDPASHPKFEKAESVQVDGLPWADDGVYRAVLFKGTKLVTPPAENGGTLAVDELEGELLSAFSVTCDTVEGDVRCVLGSLTCDEIEGDVTYCATVNADEIAGDVRQCSTINCDEINGNAVQCTNVYCDEINVD